MKFDWYQATIRDSKDAIIDVLRDAYSADLEKGKGLNGYKESFSLINDDGVVAKICSGGVNPYPNAFASGENAEAFSGIIRSVWPDEHQVSRVDSCEDISSPGAFESFHDIAKAIAGKNRMKTELAGDWEGKANGRTYYIGSRKGNRLRIYEKGKQLRHKAAYSEDLTQYDIDNWVRAEFEARPQGSHKKLAAYLSPDEMWGLSKWGVEALSLLFDQNTKRVTGKVWQKSSIEAAEHHMFKQYRNVILNIYHSCGSPDEFQEYFRAKLVENGDL